jgi:hypothetical protein
VLDEVLLDDSEVVVLDLIVVDEPNHPAPLAPAVAEALQDGGADVEHDMDLLVGFEDRGGRDAGELVDDTVDVLLRDPGVEVPDLLLEEANKDRLLTGGRASASRAVRSAQSR